MIRSVTDETFATEVLGRDGVVLLEFWGQWCGPCRALAPVLEQFADDHAGELEVLKINADENERTAALLGAMALPLMAVFRDGELVTRIIGAKPRPALEQALSGILAA